MRPRSTENFKCLWGLTGDGFDHVVGCSHTNDPCNSYNFHLIQGHFRFQSDEYSITSSYGSYFAMYLFCPNDL